MKTNSTREMIDYPWPRKKKRMDRIEILSNTIEVFIGIFDRALEISLLFVSKFGSDHSVGQLPFGMLWV